MGFVCVCVCARACALKEEVVRRSDAIFRSSKIKTEASVGLRDMDGDHWIAQQNQFQWNESLL